MILENQTLEQTQSSDSSGASPASTLIRGNSEPPDKHNEISGLRRSRNPVKIAGITMGSTENLSNGNDELAAVFANRRRRRRSATPVKIGGILMGDGEENGETETDMPFGGNKRNSYHPGLHSSNYGSGNTAYNTGSLKRNSTSGGFNTGSLKRNSNLGKWGQRIFTSSSNGQTENVSNSSDTSEKVAKNGEKVPETNEVKQFLTDMHSEIKAMTNNLTESEQNKNR